MMEQKALDCLMKNRLLHMDMLEALRHGEADILYAGGDGVLIFHTECEAYMLSAVSEESAEHITAHLTHAVNIVLHQPYLREELARHFSLQYAMPCHQAAWMRETPVPAPEAEADIRPLGMENFPAVFEHYTNIPDEAYIRSRIRAGMLGIYIKGQLAGFIGTHPEGSMGMLEVFPGYRRRGLAYRLENEMMRRRQAQGRVPFAQIMAGNAASVALHIKLGMEVTPDAPVTWLF
jgi:tRNA (guanine37-N1)-methyltransferase